jgi:acyl-homoserine-lactone acylase
MAQFPARSMSSHALAPACLAVLGALMPAAAQPARAQVPPTLEVDREARPIPERVEIRRTSYGVPHILAEDLEAAFYGLAWAHLEDHGERVVIGLVRARGELARHLGREELDEAFAWRRSWNRALATWDLQEADTRAVFEGYAAAVNRFVELHPDEFPDWVRPDFTGIDVSARWAEEEIQPAVRRFLAALERRENAESDTLGGAEDGSNAWALVPGRTTTNHAILLRNPHLNWRAGYYEAHLRVPGAFDFYGDFRVGYPLYFNGGFNPDLGWATTNNGPDIEEIYALAVPPGLPDQYRFGGAVHPLERDTVTVEVLEDSGAIASEKREFLSTSIGPVIHRTDSLIYVVKSAEQGQFRYAEQFLKMMRAKDLEEWKAAMRIRAQVVSNFTYADRDGNIFYVWNATIPRRPLPSGHDTLAVRADAPRDVWSELIPWDSLPQLRNPSGGYTHNENDPFHFTNLNEVFDPEDWPAYFPKPRMRLRSQLGASLIDGSDRLSLEEVVRRKHDMRMLMAERVKEDLLTAIRRADPQSMEEAAREGAADAAEQIAARRAEEADADRPGAENTAPPDPVTVTGDEIRAAARLLAEWDNTTASDSRGGVLFKVWYYRYFDLVIPDGDERPFDERFNDLFAESWSAERPTITPRGLADPEAAALAFAGAVAETEGLFGSWDVTWGEAHRFRLGELDLPANGCSGTLGCFRVTYYDEADDGKQVAYSGDGWVLAVEFGDTPKAYSVLAYGQSSRPDSPHLTDQLAMFARGELKRVAWTESEIERDLVRRYRPGVKRRRGAAEIEATGRAGD